MGYVEMAVIFSDSTARELRQAIDSLRALGMRTLILDLRNDPGGLLAQGVAVADLFLTAARPWSHARPESGHDATNSTKDSAPAVAWPRRDRVGEWRHRQRLGDRGGRAAGS